MKQATNWRWIVVLVGVLIWSAGCSSSSDSSGATELTVGNMGGVSIAANGTNAYRFTATSTSIYLISWDMVSTGDATTLDLVMSEPFTCTAFGSNSVCATTNNLDAGTSYQFDINEVSGVATTFRIGVAVGGP